MASIAQQLQQTGEMLAPVSGELAMLEARLLAQHAWGISHEVLVRDARADVTEIAAQQLRQAAARRVVREPLAQILGSKDFWKDRFIVTRDVLTPRADSETLIELAMKHCSREALSILDLGTGTGCLLLSALREFPLATGVAVDRSPAALLIARENARCLGLADRTVFLEGDWCNPLDKADGFDIVTSNPPYIARAQIAALDEEVKGFEPHLALDGGKDGLDCYRAIFSTLLPHLNPGAHVLMEVGEHQADAVRKIGEAQGLCHVETGRDLAGIERVVVWKNQR